MLLIKINGIYDLLSSLCMLNYIYIPWFAEAHSDLLYDKSPIIHRYYAYWIFTYGCMRLSDNKEMVSLSYLLEAIFTANELLYKNTIHKHKAIFIIVTCIGLSIITYTYL